MAAAQAKDDFQNAARSYFDGQFLDFSIISNKKEYHVHRCFIAPQSKFFERACSGMFTEDAQSKIELRDDLLEIVDRMIHYFYTFDYYDHSIGEDKNIRDASDSAHIHVRMYCIATKYDIPGLRMLALEKFKQATLNEDTLWLDLEPTARAIAEAQLPESDTALRDVVVDACLLSGRTHYGIECDFESLNTMMSDAPWLSLAISIRALRSLKSSRVAREKFCAGCKKSTIEEGSSPTLNKCNRCHGDLSYKKVTVMKYEVILSRD